MKKIIFLLLFFGFNIANAGVEYTVNNIGGTPIVGFNDGPDKEYYITYYNMHGYIGTYQLYNGTGGYVTQAPTGIPIEYQPFVFVKKNGRSIINGGNQYGQGYYIYSDGYNITSQWTTTPAENDYNGQFPIYILGDSILQYYNGQIYEWTDRSQGPYGWTLTGVNIPQNAFHYRNEYNSIIYSAGNYNIYRSGADGKYYLEGYDDNGYINFEVFGGDILGTDLERLNIDSEYKTDVLYSKFYSFLSGDQVNYYFSACYSTGKTYTTSNGTYSSNNITFRGYKDSGDVSQGFSFIDNKYYKNVYQGNWLKQLNYSEFNNYGYECNPTVTYGDFTGNVPGYMQYIRDGVLYKYVFDAQDLILFTGDTEIGGTGSTATESFGTGGVLTEDKVTEGLFDFDLDNDGEISIWEYTLAPFTFIKNMAVELYNALIYLWDFFKAILEIGKITIIPNTYASDNPLMQIINKTSDLSSGELEGGEEIYNIMTMTKYGALFTMFFLIMFFFIYLKFRN